MNFVFNLSIQNDVISKNYADFLKVSDYKEVENHTAFTKDEVQKIVGNSGGNVTRDVYTGNVTRDVYTQLEIKTLLEAVNKI